MPRLNKARALCLLAFKTTLLTLLVALTLSQAAHARFLSPDTYDPWDPGVDFNRYSYAGDDPINGSDPNGHQEGIPGVNLTPGNWPEAFDTMFCGVTCAGHVDAQDEFRGAGMAWLRGAGESIVTVGLSEAGFGVLRIGGSALLELGRGPAVSAFSSFEKLFAKIETVGNPQSTRGIFGAEHAARSENLVRDVVKAGGANNVDKIYYNTSIKTIFKGADINKRPDAVVKWKNGDFTLIEVASPNQKVDDQLLKLRRMATELERISGGKVEYKLDRTLAKSEGGKSSSTSGGNGAGKSCGNWVGGC